MRRDEQFPADLVLVSASNNTGKCFVMTANLDGETNLKPLFASKETKDCVTEELLANLQAEIECENPNTDLLSFKGRLVRRRISGQTGSFLGLENIALRGTQLREGRDYIEIPVRTLLMRVMFLMPLLDVFLNLSLETQTSCTAALSTRAETPRCP